MDLKIDNVSDELNLRARKLKSKFNNSLIDLKIIIEEIEKINNNKKLEIKKQTKSLIKHLKNLKQKRQKS